MTITSEPTEVASADESDLPHGWQWVKFGDVVRQVKTDVKPEQSDLERYVAGEHMETDDLHIRLWGTIGDGYLGPAFHRKFVKGQVLYGSRRTYLRKVAVAEFDGICANTTFVLEPAGDQLLPELLPFIMQTNSFNTHSIKQSKGSVNPYINFSDLAWYEFALPPIDEQRRIAELLWAAERAVVAWRESLLATEAMRKSFRDSLVCDPSYPRSPLATCLLRIVAGKSVIGIHRPAEASEYGVLKVSAVGEHSFVPQENKVLINAEEFMPEYSVHDGDLLITRANTRELVGRVCVVRQSYPNLMLCDKTLRLDIDAQSASVDYLFEVLRSREVRAQIEASASGTGGAMKNISQSDIRGIRVPLPTLDSQMRIVGLIAALDVAEARTRVHLAATRTAKVTLLDATLAASVQAG